MFLRGIWISGCEWFAGVMDCGEDVAAAIDARHLSSTPGSAKVRHPSGRLCLVNRRGASIYSGGAPQVFKNCRAPGCVGVGTGRCTAETEAPLSIAGRLKE